LSEVSAIRQAYKFYDLMHEAIFFAFTGLNAHHSDINMSGRTFWFSKPEFNDI
jgi:hypothetical protein